MLSISGMSGGQGDYYINLAREDYYPKGGEPPGRWRGAGAAALELDGKIDRSDFQALFAGFAPDGQEKLVQSAGSDLHRPGWDLTFSAPKSVSVLWSQAEEETRQAIQDAHFAAVSKALQYLEDEAAICRLGKGGETEVRAKLFVATFEHGTSRALDPDLHTHALVLNVGLCEDGKTRTLESKSLYQNKMVAGALYRAELSAQLQNRLGLEMEQHRTWFEVQGVSKKLMDTFSTRRKEIEALLDEKGYKGPEASAVAALATRRVKGEVARETLMEQWQTTGKAHVWSRDEAQTLIKLGTRPALNPEAEARAALDRATEKLLNRSSHFAERDLVRAMAEDLQTSRVGIDAIRAVVKEDLARPDRFVRLGEARGSRLYTTPEVIALEKELLAAAARSENDHSHCLSAAQVQKAQSALEQEKGRALTPEQQNALEHITLRQGSIQLVSGLAGTGKTDLLKAAAQAWEAAGYTVRGAAIAGIAAEGMEKGAGIESATLAATLLRLKNGSLTLDARTVLVVDEAGMVDTRQMAKLVEATEKSGTKLVLVGDARQLQAIEAGGAFLEMGRRLRPAYLTEIKRQVTDWMRQAVKDVATGKGQEALRAYALAGMLQVADDPVAARSALIADWKQEGVSRPRQHFMLTNTATDAAHLNQLAQQERQAAGYLGSENKTVGGETVYTGDRIMFTKNSLLYGVKNGRLATVESFNQARNTLTAVTDAGKRVTIPLARYDHIRLGYAATTHKGQGATIENVYALVGGTMQNLHQSYVQLSRSVKATRLYTTREAAGEDLADLSRAMERLEQKELATAVVQRHEGGRQPGRGR